MLKTIDQWTEKGLVHRVCEDESGALFVQYRSPRLGDWQHIGSDAALYRLREVLGERESGATAEAARIRREMLEADLPRIAFRVALKHGILDVPLHQISGNLEEAVHAATTKRLEEELRDLIDHVCPEPEHVTTPHS
jgi:hypothetical protein